MSAYDRFPKTALSHSQLAELRRCPKAHKLKYRQGLMRKGPPGKALEIGTLFHRVLETVGEQARWGETAVSDWDAALRNANHGVSDPSAMIEATRLIGAYRLHYGSGNAGYGDSEILAVEEVLETPDLHRDAGGFAAIADAVVREYDGTLAIYEHKTAGRCPDDDEETRRELKTGSQAGALAYCARAVYKELPVVIRNVAAKTRVVGLQRVRLVFTDAELDRWAQEQEELVEQMLPLSCANRDACSPPLGFKCNYFEFCHGTDDERADLYEARKRR